MSSTPTKELLIPHGFLGRKVQFSLRAWPPIGPANHVYVASHHEYMGYINWIGWVIFKKTPCCEGFEGRGWVLEELGERMGVNIIKIHKVLEEIIKYCI